MSHSVTLTWQAPATGTPTSYNIKRGTAKGAESNIGTATATTYVDSTGLVEGTTYFYEVTAVNAGGESVPSNEVTVLIPFSIPSAPTNLVASVV